MIVAISRLSKGFYPIAISTPEVDILARVHVHKNITNRRFPGYKVKKAIIKNFRPYQEHFTKRNNQFIILNTPALEVIVDSVTTKVTGYKNPDTPSPKIASITNNIGQFELQKAMVLNSMRGQIQTRRLNTLSKGQKIVDAIAAVNDLY